MTVVPPIFKASEKRFLVVSFNAVTYSLLRQLRYMKFAS